MRFRTIENCIKRVQAYKEKIPDGMKVEQATLVDTIALLEELRNRRSQTCARCIHFDGCCTSQNGLLNAEPWDYCSRWVEKKEVK